MGNVILATTMWRPGKEAIEERREAELKNCYWKGMIDRGSRVVRFHRTFDSAWTIVDIIDRNRDTRRPLLLQKELVDTNLQLDETLAGSQLYKTFKVPVTGRIAAFFRFKNTDSGFREEF